MHHQHHSRRKSGHVSANTSMTDVRKATVGTTSSSSRPPISRKNTPQTLAKLGKNPRDREREWEEERWSEDDRESFPHFCMICEKQFIPNGELLLYCSEICRNHDQSSAGLSSIGPNGLYASPIATSAPLYPLYSSNLPEPRDIVPRASPSRPCSTHYASPPTSPMTAISSLRSLSQMRPPSPPSPTTPSGTLHSASSSTNIWPFTRSAATSPSTSYTRSIVPPASYGVYPSTYDAGGYYAGSVTGYGGYGYQYVGATASAAGGMDRPLPTRRSTYSRPKSIELVTPVVGR